MFTRYGLPLVAAGLLAFAVYSVLTAQKTPPGSTALPVEPPRNPNAQAAENVAGAGMIEPQTENISIGSPVAGLVVKVYVEVGQKVAAGAELFQLDDRQAKAELAWRRAALAAARADLERLENQPRRELVDISQAKVAEMEASLADMRDQLQRARSLYGRKAIPEEEVFRREQAAEMASARLTQAKADLAMQKAGAWEYDKEVARAAVVQAEAQVQQAETELDRLVIRSYVEGQVLQVNVRPGEFVGAPANQTLMVLGNIERLHVRVDISEYDLHRFRTDMPAIASLKGQPDVTFPLKFVRVEPFVIPKRSLTGNNSERVDTRVLQVIYALDSGAHKLYVGQQVDVFIDPSLSTARR
jgi:multidrug resistance efflux pump